MGAICRSRSLAEPQMDSGPVLLGDIGGTHARFALARLPALQHSESKGRYALAIAPVPTFATVRPQPGLLGAAVPALASAAMDED
jgi:glucokinase